MNRRHFLRTLSLAGTALAGGLGFGAAATAQQPPGPPQSPPGYRPPDYRPPMQPRPARPPYPGRPNQPPPPLRHERRPAPRARAAMCGQTATGAGAAAGTCGSRAAGSRSAPAIAGCRAIGSSGEERGSISMGAGIERGPERTAAFREACCARQTPTRDFRRAARVLAARRTVPVHPAIVRARPRKAARRPSPRGPGRYRVDCKFPSPLVNRVLLFISQLADISFGN